MSPAIQMPVPTTAELWSELERRHAKMHQPLRTERCKPSSERDSRTIIHLGAQMLMLRDIGRFFMGVPENSDDDNPFGSGEDF